MSEEVQAIMQLLELGCATVFVLQLSILWREYVRLTRDYIAHLKSFISSRPNRPTD